MKSSNRTEIATIQPISSIPPELIVHDYTDYTVWAKGYIHVLKKMVTPFTRINIATIEQIIQSGLDDLKRTRLSTQIKIECNLNDKTDEERKAYYKSLSRPLRDILTILEKELLDPEVLQKKRDELYRLLPADRSIQDYVYKTVDVLTQEGKIRGFLSDKSPENPRRVLYNRVRELNLILRETLEVKKDTPTPTTSTPNRLLEFLNKPIFGTKK